MNLSENTPCERADLVRDYVFDELAQPDRRSMEQHFRQCTDCVGELDRLRLTTAALRVLPDQEVPRRIAFVSDKVFAPGWLAGFWNSAARLGFASACVLAAGISFAALHRPPDVPTVVQTASVSAATINEAVNKAVALAVQKAHDDDIQMTRAALDEVDRKYAQKQQNLMVAMQSNLEYFQKTYEKNARNSYTVWPTGARQ
jgi:anti-sigma factor RsiW